MENAHAVVSGKSFAELSLRAAEEADRQLRGQNARTDVLREWATRLSEISGLGETAEMAFLQSDPDAADVIARALDEASNKTIDSVSDVNLATKKIVGPLLDHAERLSNDELRLLRQFCLALHRAILALRLPPMFDPDLVDEEFRRG